MSEQERLAYEAIQKVNEDFKGWFGLLDLEAVLIFYDNNEYGLEIPYGDGKSISFDSINQIMESYDEEEQGMDKYEYKNLLLNHKRLQEEGFEPSFDDVDGIQTAEKVDDYLRTYYFSDLEVLKKSLFEQVNIELSNIQKIKEA